MEQENKVVLLGMWASPYTKRVELALKLKGISHEYVEEDMFNKSPLVFKYNPAYKRLPVLVHNGNPIVESLIIYEYIDETWKNGRPQILPADPYKRAQVRFWASFIHQQQTVETMVTVLKSGGEAQEKDINKMLEIIKVLEEGVKDIYNVGYLDFFICSVFSFRSAMEKVLGIKILDSEKTPLLYSWVTKLNDLALVKETIASHEKLVEVLKVVREKALQTCAT
ncbi:PREDICTED: glutathione S-transferase U9 [Theobroma cacao]|uniref:Glutathione S-transferase n=1 Tax=Theobroma cacao TaxID=3641 RepID=A0AB32VXX1_THECC|nr:PREDICTED: glutathione S-transferase U9 [Theobroma cacao]